MNNRQDDELKELKEQINDIKSVINISGSTFRLIYAADNFRRFFMLSGVFSLLLPIVYQVLIYIYKSHQQIPVYLLTIFYSLIVICWCVLIFIRTKVSMTVSKRLDINSSIVKIIKEILSTRIWLAIIPTIVFLAAIPIKYSLVFASTDYVPYFSIVLGLLLNMIGVLINEKEYSVAGSWMIISGVIVFFFVTIPVNIAFALILSPACFLFALVNNAANKHKESQNEIG